jgi:hypothetical protein
MLTMIKKALPAAFLLIFQADRMTDQQNWHAGAVPRRRPATPVDDCGQGRLGLPVGRDLGDDESPWRLANLMQQFQSGLVQG